MSGFIDRPTEDLESVQKVVDHMTNSMIDNSILAVTPWLHIRKRHHVWCNNQNVLKPELGVEGCTHCAGLHKHHPEIEGDVNGTQLGERDFNSGIAITSIAHPPGALERMVSAIPFMQKRKVH